VLRWGGIRVGAAFALSSGSGEYCVVTKRYVARQVAALLEFSKLTRDTALSVALIQRAADLKLRSDEAARDDGNDLRAPDVLLGK
jgi:hypothetical protein